MKRLVYYFLHKSKEHYRYVKFFEEHLKEISEYVQTIHIEDEQYNFEYLSRFINDKREEWSGFDKIAFITDDWFGPITNFNYMFEKMELEKVNIWSVQEDHKGSINPEFFELDAKIVDQIVEFNLNDYLQKNPFATYMVHDTYRISKYLKNKKVPVINVNSIIHDYEEVLDVYSGEDTKNIYLYIRDNTDYDTSMLWEYFLKHENMCDIMYNMQMMNILSYTKSDQVPITSKIALIMHIYYDDLVNECFKYANNMPKECDVYITTDSQEKIDKIKTVFEKGNFHKLEFILIENRGRDISALLVGGKKVIENYDYICFTHDKKVKQLKNELTGESFSSKCFENILGSPQYIRNIIQLFDREKNLGLLFAPAPNIGEYYPTLGYFDWGNNYDNVKALYDRLHLDIEISHDKEPIAPLGTMFWFRSDALKGLVDQGWSYEDFPKEPNNNDGTLLHAVERIYPFCAQQQGYYSAWVMNETFAQTELNNMYYMLKSLNKRVFNYFGADTHKNLINKIDISLEKNGPVNSELEKDLKEYAEVADYYRSKSDDFKNTLLTTQEMLKIFKEKSQDFEKSLHSSQEMVEALKIKNDTTSAQKDRLENENNLLKATIADMQNTKVWKVRSLLRKAIGKN